MQRLTHLPATLQARFVTGGVRFIASRVFGFRIEVSGEEHLPPGEPLIVAGGPHRNWIDGFLLIIALPAEPRLTFLASETADDLWWRRIVIRLVGGFEPVSTTSALNREAIEAALRVLARGDRLGIFPEGWHHLEESPREIGELRRGVAFIAQQSGRRVLPVALAGTQELWRGKTLRMHVAPPLAALAAGSDRAAEQAYVDRLREVLQEAQPPLPPEPSSGKKPWRWLTRFL